MVEVSYQPYDMLYQITAWLRYYFKTDTASKVFKYGIFSGLYFPVFSPNTGKCGTEETQYLDTFHTVRVLVKILLTPFSSNKEYWKNISNVLTPLFNLPEKPLKNTVKYF